GENHLLLRHRKGSNLSGLVEPRIPAPLGRGVSIGTVPETLSRAFYKLTQEGKFEVNGTKIILFDKILTSKHD
ncbi:MAG: hypothetical protein EAZ87_24155, partial [Nostocales cyanobacterium]